MPLDPTTQNNRPKTWDWCYYSTICLGLAFAIWTLYRTFAMV